MDAQGYWTRWHDNAERCGVAPSVVDEITRRYGISPASFRVLDALTEVRDPDGKSFFVLPRGIAGQHAREAALMTYVVNAGTGYGKAGDGPTDFPATPYAAAEVARIAKRQNDNHWTYGRDVGFVHRNGGRLASTPNGILMGLGGNWIQRLFSARAGTTWGDIFMVNVGGVPDGEDQLRRIVRSGRAWYADRDGTPRPSGLALDRVLHHEERHCRQWADRGYLGMLSGYGRELLRELSFGVVNEFEEEAGLADGGYRRACTP
ncbi:MULTISPECIES: hypothetical protein [unclassified Mycobacterium]|uniref:hypothetical protein n=1 Tax=unclassified Mycobacterium TaxID=2642494 RepID=UPI0007FDEEBA|nr:MULTISPECIES: hypothetical protein [unclassified Mycobacterium]OBG76428.1 hypothetical protein A5700_21705 [Mycobacterium sp. E1214]OBH24473.1 hypothetical protein A5693_07945 [Mycobacterium sp. E1319]